MKILAKLSLGKKILVLVAILATLQIVSSIYSINQMRGISSEFGNIQEEEMPLISVTTDINAKQLEKTILIEKVLRLSGLHSSEQTIPKLQEQITRLAEDINIEIKRGESILLKAQSHALSDELSKEIAALSETLKTLESEHTEFEVKVEQIMRALNTGEQVSASALIEIEQTQEKLNHHLASMLKSIEVMTEHTLDQVQQDEMKAISLMAVLSVISIIIGILISIAIAKGIINPIKEVIANLKSMATGNGDLTVRLPITSQDEIGELSASFNQFVEKLQNMITDISKAIEQLAAATEETSVVTRATSENIANQKHETTQVASAINEMTATVKEVAESAERASIEAKNGDEQTRTGKIIIDQVVLSINLLASEIDKSSDVIQSVKSGSLNIGTVLDVIKNIAEQTNLLALNAAIEAARAGEQGRGFAVVADEVRSLAQKTQDSTKQIEKLITDLQVESDNAVTTMEQNRTGIQGLVDKTSKATESLNAITLSVTSINDMNTLIATAAEEQSYVVEEINRSIHNIQEISEDTSRGASEVSQASGEIAQLTEQLKMQVNQFKIL